MGFYPMTKCNNYHVKPYIGTFLLVGDANLFWYENALIYTSLTNFYLCITFVQTQTNMMMHNHHVVATIYVNESKRRTPLQ